MISDYMTLEVEKGGTGTTTTKAERKQQNPAQIDLQQEVIINEDGKEEESKTIPQ